MPSRTSPNDSDVGLLSQFAVEMGVAPIVFYAAACRGELTSLMRIGGQWGCARTDAERVAAAYKGRLAARHADAVAAKRRGKLGG